MPESIVSKVVGIVRARTNHHAERAETLIGQGRLQEALDENKRILQKHGPFVESRLRRGYLEDTGDPIGELNRLDYYLGALWRADRIFKLMGENPVAAARSLTETYTRYREEIAEEARRVERLKSDSRFHLKPAYREAMQLSGVAVNDGELIDIFRRMTHEARTAFKLLLRDALTNTQSAEAIREMFRGLPSTGIINLPIS